MRRLNRLAFIVALLLLTLAGLLLMAHHQGRAEQLLSLTFIILTIGTVTYEV